MLGYTRNPIRFTSRARTRQFVRHAGGYGHAKNDNHGHNHDHDGHGHAKQDKIQRKNIDALDIEDLKSQIPEYLKKFMDDKSPHSWTNALLQSPATLECIAEINTSEFKVTSLSAGNIIRSYKEQLGHFEGVRKLKLEAEGVSPCIIENLHNLYQLRANVPLWEVERAVKEIGFLADEPHYRVTRAALEDFPSWKQAKGQLPSTLFFNKNYDPAVGLAGRTNQEDCALNVKRLRGARGLLAAVEKGLTSDQIDKIINVFVSAQTVSEEDLKQIEDAVSKIKGNKNHKEARTLFQEVMVKFAGGPGYKVFLEKLNSGNPAPFNLHQDLDNIKDTKGITTLPSDVRDRVTKALTSNKSNDKVKKLSSSLEFLLKPEQQKELTLLDNLANAELTPKQEADILAIFEQASDSETDALLNDVMNPHPIAARLFGDRVQIFSQERVHYTRHYEEGAETGFQPVETDPRYQKDFDTNPILESPTPDHVPWNTAVEEIFQMKLERLATDYLKIDLQSDLGVAQFDSFCHSFDISPGEYTLDRTHGYPPPHHTYDELPIIKFDGYDPIAEPYLGQVPETHASH